MRFQNIIIIIDEEVFCIKDFESPIFTGDVHSSISRVVAPLDIFIFLLKFLDHTYSIIIIIVYHNVADMET